MGTMTFLTPLKLSAETARELERACVAGGARGELSHVGRVDPALYRPGLRGTPRADFAPRYGARLPAHWRAICRQAGAPPTLVHGRASSFQLEGAGSDRGKL